MTAYWIDKETGEMHPFIAMSTATVLYPESQIKIIQKHSGMLTCEYCRRKNKIAAEFCAGCGAPINNE